MATLLTADMISEITLETWEAILAEAGSRLSPKASRPGEEITGYVDIADAWRGNIGLTCSLAAAKHAASIMFDMDESELGQSEINDAIGELVNIVGGNIKALLPAPAEMSIPHVIEGSPVDDPDRPPPLREVRFEWLDELVIVRVWMMPTDEESSDEDA